MGRPAPHRVGQPSPLVLHLNAALAGYGQALLAAPRAGGIDPIDVAAESAARLSATLRGLEIWQCHPYRRTLAEPRVIWSAGASRLLDYGTAPEAADPAGPPVLVVPSLINRAYILDLLPGYSMLRWLAAQGLRPVLLDWGAPGPAEAGYALDDYVSHRLMPALAALRAQAGGGVALMGYCMGGTLAAGVAARAPEAVTALVTLGAPWDFACARGLAGALRAALRAQGVERGAALLHAVGQTYGLVPDALFQTLFALIDPMQAAVKFQRLARMDAASGAAERFVALEDWLADGVAMPVRAAEDLLIRWQLGNATVAGGWNLLGGPVALDAVAVPTLAFCGRGDTIAPPAVSEPLAAGIEGARIERPGTGHVGMAVGRAARAEVWEPAARFLAAHAG